MPVEGDYLTGQPAGQPTSLMIAAISISQFLQTSDIYVNPLKADRSNPRTTMFSQNLHCVNTAIKSVP